MAKFIKVKNMRRTTILKKKSHFEKFCRLEKLEVAAQV